MKVTVLEFGIGVIVAWAMFGPLVSPFFGVSATDSATFGIISVLLAAIGLAACYLTVRTAIRLNPVEARRYE